MEGNDNLPLTISVGRSRKETEWTPKQTTWGKLKAKLSKTQRTLETAAEYAAMTKDEKAAAKDIGGFVGGEFSAGARKNQNVRSRQILALDIDYGTADTWDGYTMMCDWECLMHTTHSHTPENPRYRMYFPMKRAVSKEEYEPIARKVAEAIDMELFDDTTYQAARLMFWPSTPKDGEFKVWTQEGGLIDPDEILGEYEDWHDQSEWPTSSRTKIRIHQSAEKQESPYKKKGLVGAFCRVYDIPGAIDKYLTEFYEAVPYNERRYSHIGSSTIGGLALYGDAGKEDTPPWCFCYSHHETDESSGMMLNAFDLVRVHLYPQMNDTESYEQMRKLCASDEDVRIALEEIGLENSTDFQDEENREDTLIRREADYTEMGNAIKLKDRDYRIARYNAATDWCIWDGEVWRQNSTTEATMLVMNQADRMLDEGIKHMQLAPHPENPSKKSSWDPDYAAAMAEIAWAKTSRGYNNAQNTLKFARSLMEEKDPDSFDRNPWMLNTPAGIVDLTTGVLKAHDSTEMCTMMTSESPAEGPHPMYDAFLDRVTGGDREFQTYLQEVAGMALVGKVYEEGLVIVYGPGGNGKSTLFSVWQTLMGTYSETVRNEVLMGSKNGGEVAGQNLLRGKRLVITSELEESTVMQNSLLKRLTSRDKISANVKYHEPITFTPSHTLILHTNHLPRLRSIDGGTVRRLAVAPFEAVIKPTERVTDFAGQLLKAEGPQILRWMIEGAMKFHEAGMRLSKPEVVRKATDEYIDGEDVLKEFIAERCIQNPSEQEKAGDLRDAFFTWVGETKSLCGFTRKSFRSEVERRGFKYKDTRTGAVVQGLRLIRETDEDFSAL